MTYGKILGAITGCAVVMMLSSCAYDPYYHPLAAHPAYRENVVVVGHGPGPHAYNQRYYDHHYRGWGDHDWDDRY